MKKILFSLGNKKKNLFYGLIQPDLYFGRMILLKKKNKNKNKNKTKNKKKKLN